MIQQPSFKEVLFGAIGVAGTVGALLLAPLWVAFFMAAVAVFVVVPYASRHRAWLVAIAVILTIAGIVAALTNSSSSTSAAEDAYRDQLSHLAQQIDDLSKAGSRDQGPGEPKQNTNLPDQIPLQDLAPLRMATVEYINRLRDHYGVPPVMEATDLNLIAQRHVRQMIRANELTHEAAGHPFPDVSTIGYSFFGQVIAGGDATFSWTSTVEMWIRSKSHRLVLLSPDATSIGVGVELDAPRPYKHLWTVVLAGRN